MAAFYGNSEKFLKLRAIKTLKSLAVGKDTVANDVNGFIKRNVSKQGCNVEASYNNLVCINIIPQSQNVQSQNCISITCCSDSTGYFVKEMRYLLYLTFKVRYSKYIMLAWQLNATTRETPHENILNMAATIFDHVFLRF